MRLRRLEQSEKPMQSLNLQGSFRPVSMKFLAILAFLSVSLLLAAPGHTGFLDKALHFGRDVLAKAAINYTNKYERKLNNLLQSLSQPDAYPQGQGFNDPYNPNQGYPQDEPYGQNQGGYPTDPNYGRYPQTGQQQGGGYGEFPSQGYPADPNVGNYPSESPNQYGQAQGGYPSNDPNM